MTITREDEGEVVRVRKGQPVTIELPSNPSAGYAWRVAATDRSFGYPTSTEIRAEDPEVVGGGSTTVMRWETDSVFEPVGTHRVVLEYARPWETEEAPLAVIELTIRVFE